MSDWPASKRQIDLAGDRLRTWWSDLALPASLLEQEEWATALDLIDEFRSGFQLPLNKVTMGVRSFMRSERTPVVVGQRLKRLPTIVDKLARLPRMKLSRMHDIGGCRAIVASVDDLYGVFRRIERRWKIERVYDYIASPKRTGYRGIHVIVLRDGRLIEIQLRTQVQQSWAAEVERLGGRLGVNLKDGEGPPEVIDFFARLAAVSAAYVETGGPIPDAAMQEIATALRNAREYLM